ncbi:MAG: MarR family transcriptional regulator [Betaproteobacteria bacterium]|nr:MAG: MarR family transcriptional regulator [Betaproteobacteria bacterium]TAG46946.1 MAG: MarR family transcriptional regulator [Betaproteobacteria bacterium]
MSAEFQKPAYLPTLRALVRCNQAFERFSSAHVRKLGLTAAQFDVVATLGNTPGMSCKDLGEKTLITKGTLTGVLDRLEATGTLKRRADKHDARRVHVSLTAKGSELFDRVFPAHLTHCETAFAQLSLSELTRLHDGLQRLRSAFESESRA